MLQLLTGNSTFEMNSTIAGNYRLEALDVELKAPSYELPMNKDNITNYSTSPTGSENHLSPLRFQTFNRKIFWNRNEAIVTILNNATFCVWMYASPITHPVPFDLYWHCGWFVWCHYLSSDNFYIFEVLPFSAIFLYFQ